ncbi:hypothetical protein VNI00_005139 [Paramarasmius palmivorus]|uniref:ABC transmembrane type-1 domain-containing protein n=1 Tax=Paramarasmius palmivorus TaxID=297713 RepID=A0AAW0DLD1_9AGAR
MVTSHPPSTIDFQASFDDAIERPHVHRSADFAGYHNCALDLRGSQTIQYIAYGAYGAMFRWLHLQFLDSVVLHRVESVWYNILHALRIYQTVRYGLQLQSFADSRPSSTAVLYSRGLSTTQVGRVVHFVQIEHQMVPWCQEILLDIVTPCGAIFSSWFIAYTVAYLAKSSASGLLADTLVPVTGMSFAINKARTYLGRAVHRAAHSPSLVFEARPGRQQSDNEFGHPMNPISIHVAQVSDTNSNIDLGSIEDRTRCAEKLQTSVVTTPPF